MGVSTLPRQHYQTFGMSHRISAMESETDRGENDNDDSSEVSSRRSSPEAKSQSPISPPAASDSDNVNDESHPGSIEEGAASAGEEEMTTERTNHTGRCNTALGLLLEQFLFFLAGLGSSIGYIATLSSLVYFKVLFGANSFVYLNCAVFLPLLPISVAQAIWDSQFDLLYQSKVTFLVRFVLGYSFCVIGTLGMIAFARGKHNDENVEPHDTLFAHEKGKEEGLEWVILWALFQGIGGAVLFGQLNQLASFIGSLHNAGGNNLANAANQQPSSAAQSDENDDEALAKKFKATVSAGVQASALVVLVASIASGFGTMNGHYFAGFLVRILQVEAFCFAASLWLLLARPRIQVSMLRRDTSMRELMRFSGTNQLEEFQQLLSPTNDNNEDNDSEARLRLPLLQPLPPSPDGSRSSNSGSERSDGSNGEHTILTLRKLLYHSRLSCLAMALTLVPSFLVGSWFTRVQTDWMELAQILFYVRIGSDLTGRFATILIPPRSIECVVWIAGLRCVAVGAFFANASCKIPSLSPWGRDCLSISLVAGIAFCSGYLVTSCYQLAPQQLPGTPRVKAANVAKQSSLLTVAFSVSAIGGLVTSFVLVAIGV